MTAISENETEVRLISNGDPKFAYIPTWLVCVNSCIYVNTYESYFIDR